MEGFKSSENRLVHVFKKSRECWKENAAKKQKKLRALEVKIRDLSNSRDAWKIKHSQAVKEIQQLKEELEFLKKNLIFQKAPGNY